MNNSTFRKNLKIAELSILSAIVIMMTFVPYIGYISYGGLSITLIHIPVIIGACAMGPLAGSFLGGVWGISCMLKALFAPPTPLEGIIFKNPLVSVIPRILAGLVAGLLFKAFTKYLKNDALPSALSAALASVTNTVFVMGLIYLIYGEKYGTELGIASVNFGGLTNYILAAFGINAVIEIAVGIIITIPVVKALSKMRKVR